MYCDVCLHGDTTACMFVMRALFNFLAGLYRIVHETLVQYLKYLY